MRLSSHSILDTLVQIRQLSKNLFILNEFMCKRLQIYRDASFDNMQFLTLEQILHDVAAFIESIRTQHNSITSRVILWGSGYGATLATWARKKYPHLIDGAWSSSGVFEIDLASLSNNISILLKTSKIELTHLMAYRRV